MTHLVSNTYRYVLAFIVKWSAPLIFLFLFLLISGPYTLKIHIFYLGKIINKSSS